MVRFQASPGLAEATEAEALGPPAPSGVRAEEETALWEDPLMTAAQSLFFFWLTAKNVSRDRREFRGFGLNCGGNTEDIAVELAIEEMCAGCYCARPGMRRGLI